MKGERNISEERKQGSASSLGTASPTPTAPPQVAQQLISDDKVDMLVSSGTPDTVNPAADQAEALGCPFVSCFNPWQAFIFGRGATPATEYKWIYGFYFGVDQEVVTESMAYEKLATNKKIGFLFANDTDGNVWAQAFVNTTVADAMGPTAEGMMASSAFHRNFPFKDALTGLTAAELCDQYEKDTGLEWAQTIGTHAKFTWAIDVLKRAKDIDNKETIAEAIQTTKMELITGPVDFTAPVDMAGIHITKNVCKQGWANTQMVKGKDRKPTP